MVADQMPEVVWTSRVPTLPHHDMKAAGGEAWEFVASAYEGQIRINARDATLADARQPRLRKTRSTLL